MATLWCVTIWDVYGFRFNVMTATVTADSVVYDKKRKAA